MRPPSWGIAPPGNLRRNRTEVRADPGRLDRAADSCGQMIERPSSDWGRHNQVGGNLGSGFTGCSMPKQIAVTPGYGRPDPQSLDGPLDCRRGSSIRSVWSHQLPADAAFFPSASARWAADFTVSEARREICIILVPALSQDCRTSTAKRLCTTA